MFLAGRIDVWRPAGGFGIRLDSGSLHPGARVLPYYDSMLMKVGFPTFFFFFFFSRPLFAFPDCQGQLAVLAFPNFFFFFLLKNKKMILTLELMLLVMIGPIGDGYVRDPGRCLAQSPTRIG